MCCDVWNSRSDAKTNILITGKMSPKIDLVLLSLFDSSDPVVQSNNPAQHEQ